MILTSFIIHGVSSLMQNTEMTGRTQGADEKIKGIHVRKRTSLILYAFKGFDEIPGFHPKYQSFE